MKAKYIVKWGDGFSQKVSSLTDAIKIIRDLIKDHPSVTVSKLKE
jgi:hypothetical protein